MVSIYDADTITVDIDLGLGVWVRGEKLRLARINAPELRGKEREEGLKARVYLVEQISNKDIVIETVKDKKGKYGRYVAEIWLSTRNINDALVGAGHAVYREY